MAIHLQRLSPRGRKQHRIQPEGIRGRSCHADMTKMRRIEGSAKESYAHSCQQSYRTAAEGP